MRAADPPTAAAAREPGTAHGALAPGSTDGDKLPAWSVTLRNGAKVTLVRDEAAERNMLHFKRDDTETTIVLSDAALAAVVALAVTKAGVPVHAG